MRYIGLDLGSKTCGISISDSSNKIASGLLNFEYNKNNMMLIIHKLRNIMKEYDDVGSFILGYPTNPRNNEKVESTYRVEEFQKILIKEFGNIEVIYQDENFSTSIASTMLFDAEIKSAKRKKIIDMVSAVVILQDFLDHKLINN